MRERYDVIVIGGGHAGAEAAWAASSLLRREAGLESCVLRPESNSRLAAQDSGRISPARVALITMDPSKIGAMSCNPAIGGLAKGQMVREIDALGGLMGLAADATGIQFRVLNASKGPAVQGPRCQSDKYAYAREVQRLLATRENLDVIAGTIEDFLVEDGACGGVEARVGHVRVRLRAKAVVLTTGTFMRALMHTGERKTEGGRVGEGVSVGVSGALRRLGFDLGRLKTGTPPRLRRETIDLASLQEQPGDARPVAFSEMTGVAGGAGIGSLSAYATVAERFPVLPQTVCWITHTNGAIHDLIRANLDRAPMYNGQIAAGNVGPRYCPSIEDKVVRFADRHSHHVFLEPESLETDEVYCNGISTSLPADVQEAIVRLLPGCEKAEILRHGYAVEYDMVWPHQIDATCMTKRVPGLFLAGQINGTSGYEEAAGQGLIAGLNAARYARDPEGFREGAGGDFRGFRGRLGREQAYIGVMLDDLVTKTPREPYRMFTSRAEHRLTLRADNADERLTPLGRELGLVDDARWGVFEAKRAARESLRAWLATPQRASWARRPGVDASAVLASMEDEPLLGGPLPGAAVIDSVLADLQYEGYVARQRGEIARLAERESLPLPTDEAHDYRSVAGLRTEAAITLNRFRPATLGQAGRLAGVNPTDLMILSVSLARA